MTMLIPSTPLQAGGGVGSPGAALTGPQCLSFSPYSHGSLTEGLQNGAFSTATYPAANEAFFVPFRQFRTVNLVRLWVANGTSVSGNFDIGIYTRSGSKLVSAGSTAQSGTSTLQSVTIAYQLLPGEYFLAVAMDNTSGHLFRASNTLQQSCTLLGAKKMAAAFPLPATATLETMDQDYFPAIGMATVTVV